MENNSNCRKSKPHIQRILFPATADEIFRELGPEKSFQIYLIMMSLLLYVQKYERLFEFLVRLFQQIGVSVS